MENDFWRKAGFFFVFKNDGIVRVESFRYLDSDAHATSWEVSRSFLMIGVDTELCRPIKHTVCVF